MTPRAIHAVLAETLEKLVGLHGNCDKVSPDTAFAIGLAAGTIMKAKALVGRDIDNDNQKP